MDDAVKNYLSQIGSKGGAAKVPTKGFATVGDAKALAKKGLATRWRNHYAGAVGAKRMRLDQVPDTYVAAVKAMTKEDTEAAVAAYLKREAERKKGD